MKDIIRELENNSEEMKSFLVYARWLMFIYDVWQRILTKKTYFIGLFNSFFKRKKTTSGSGKVVSSDGKNDFSI